MASAEDAEEIPSVLPAEVHEPVLTQAPPPGRKFPCSQCGARLDFDPSLRSLACPYCGHVEEIAPGGPVEERDYEKYFETAAAAPRPVVANEFSEVRCTGCGAVVVMENKLVTDKCPYCATHLENKPEALHDMILPEGILPFAVTNKTAISKFNDWVSGRWFAPNDFKNFANLGRLSGVYVPHWTYDSMTYSSYSGQRGDNYVVHETYTAFETFTSTNASGQLESHSRPVTRTRAVTKIRWTPVSGEVDHFFDDVLVCASHSLPPELLSSIASWDLQNLEGFNPAFLSGLSTERYQVDLKEGFDTAERIMDDRIRELCCRDIGGDHQRLEHVSTQHVGVTFKHVLFPLWLAAYRYRDQPYRILINGRTGSVAGTRPYSWIKITLFTLAMIVLAIAVFFLLAAATGNVQFSGSGLNPPSSSASVALLRETAEPAAQSLLGGWQRMKAALGLRT